MTSACKNSALPRAFICPLTEQPLRQPVLAPDGYTYDKEALNAWQDQYGRETSPKTLIKMPPWAAVPNHVMARTLQEYFQQEQPNFPAARRDDWRQNLFCPVGLAPMLRPVRLSDGVDYDADMAAQILRTFANSPVTRAPFTVEERQAALSRRTGFWADRTLQALAVELGEVIDGPTTEFGSAPAQILPTFNPSAAHRAPRPRGLDTSHVASQFAQDLRAAHLDGAEQHLEALLRLDPMSARACLLAAHDDTVREFDAIAGKLLGQERQLLTLRGLLRAVGKPRATAQWCNDVQAAHAQLVPLAWLSAQIMRYDISPDAPLDLEAARLFVQNRMDLMRRDARAIELTQYMCAMLVVAPPMLPAILGPDHSRARGVLVFCATIATLVGLPKTVSLLAQLDHRLRLPLVHAWAGEQNTASPWPTMQARPVLCRAISAVTQGVMVGLCSAALLGILGLHALMPPTAS